MQRSSVIALNRSTRKENTYKYSSMSFAFGFHFYYHTFIFSILYIRNFLIFIYDIIYFYRTIFYIGSGSRTMRKLMGLVLNMENQEEQRDL